MLSKVSMSVTMEEVSTVFVKVIRRVSPPEVRWLLPESKRVTVKVSTMPAMAVEVPSPVKTVWDGSVVVT